jgi:ribosomal protein L20
MVQDRKKEKQACRRRWVTGLNVNILTMSLVQTAFLGLQKSVDHVQNQLSEISQKVF